MGKVTEFAHLSNFNIAAKNENMLRVHAKLWKGLRGEMETLGSRWCTMPFIMCYLLKVFEFHQFEWFCVYLISNTHMQISS